MKAKFKHPIYSYLGVLGSILYHTVLGSFYTWGCISIYCTSYLRQFHPSVTTHTLSLFLTARTVSLLFMNPIGTYFDQKFGPKLGMLIGAIFFGGAVYFTSTSHSPAIYILGLGIGFGVPNGFGYVPAISTSWKHFPKSKGIISGIIFFGFGIGSFIFSFVSKELVNPNNIKPTNINGEYIFPLEVANNVPHMLRVLGVIWVIIMLVSLVLIKEIYDMEEESPLVSASASSRKTSRSRLNSVVAELHSDVIGHFRSSYFQHYEEENNEKDALEVEMFPFANKNSVGNEEYIANCTSVSAGLKSSQFLLALYMFTSSTLLDYTVLLMYKELGNRYGYDDAFLTTIGSIIGLCNATGRLFWGYIMQKIPFKKVYITVIIGQMLFFMLIFIIGKYRYMFAGCMIMCILFVCANFPVFPCYCAEVFGDRLASQLYGFLTSSFTFAALIFNGLNLIIPWIGYNCLIYIIMGLNVVNIPILFTINMKPKW